LSFFFFFNNERERREREREKERFLSWFLMGADMTSFGQNFGASQVCLKEKDISTQNE
jgi:hypothetical protein